MYSAYASGREVPDVEKPTYVSGQKVLDVEKAKYTSLGKEMHSTCTSGQKVLDAEIAKQSFLSRKKSQKVDDAEIISLEAVRTSKK